MPRIHTPHEYALALGWDHSQIEATARLGVAPYDLDALADTDVTAEALLAWCREQTVADETTRWTARD